MGKITAYLLKRMATGKFFVFPKQAAWVYWHFQGIKGAIGLVCGFTLGLIVLLNNYGLCDVAAAHWAWFQCDVWTSHVEHFLIWTSGVFLYLSQVDGGIHTAGPDMTLEEVMENFKK